MRNSPQKSISFFSRPWEFGQNVPRHPPIFFYTSIYLFNLGFQGKIFLVVHSRDLVVILLFGGSTFGCAILLSKLPCNTVRTQCDSLELLSISFCDTFWCQEMIGDTSNSPLSLIQSDLKMLIHQPAVARFVLIFGNTVSQGWVRFWGLYRSCRAHLRFLCF